MNELIEQVLKDLLINKIPVPVAFAFYEGHGEPYVTYQLIDTDTSFSGDDDIMNWVDYYDVDIYSKVNYTKIVDEVMNRMKDAGFIWQVERSGGDLFEPDTGYYHRNLNFAYIRGFENG